ncbi:MAG TPA: cyclic nucleotide-binding domain-containing protein [Candidatus Marinimicrobia bacterium]|nr:cyclic nucleotide-binding domain-containing protein [Candidatus Neomarinimicrobiota bacterium]HRS52035.1 cyclic nucleotide-binding domain-containing protein [Candidatus Neomarinimicrobiota bacterium]HRU91637.1 cyclic nucleotide-binding domain-containing protein [Candidatus Neomarinimicrobiota bacterium]
MNNPLWENISFKKKSELSDIMQILSNVPIFSDLDSKELSELEKIVYHRKYKKGEPIFRMGDPGLGMYIIVNGAVEIVEEPENGEIAKLAELGKGAFFGDLALLDEEPRSASAIAMVDSDIIGFFRPDLMDLVYRKPRMGIKILWALSRVVGERLRKTNEQLTNLQREMKAQRNE